MPTVIPAGFAQASAIFYQVLGGDDALVVTGHDIGLGPNDPTDIANAVFDTWEGSNLGRALQANTWAMRQVNVRVNRGAGIELGVSTRAQIGGVSTDPGLPPNTVFLVQKKTALGGREFRGRMYLPGQSEGIVTNLGFILSQYLAIAQGHADEFLANSITNDVRLVILHSSPQLGPVPAPTNVTSLKVAPVVATQRRRLR